MGLQLGARENELGREVAVHDRVERAGRDGLEAEVAREGIAVQGHRRSRQRPRAQGQHVHAATRVSQPLVVAHQAPGVAGHEVAQRDRLRHPRVGEARHDRVRATRPLLRQGPYQRGRVRAQGVDRAADPQAQRGDRLLVPAPAQMGLAREVADAFGEARLDPAVNVLLLRARESLGSGLVQNGRQTGVQRGGIRNGDGARSRKRHDIGPGGRDLLAHEPPVEGQRPVELPELPVRLTLVVAAPELHDR